jgi:hypothetical protein
MIGRTVLFITHYILTKKMGNHMNIATRLICIIALLTLGFSAYAGTSVGTSLITDDGTQYQVANLSQESSDIAKTLKAGSRYFCESLF